MLDVSRRMGIARHVAVTDPSVRRLLRRSGLDVHEHAFEASRFGCPVTLCGWEVDEGFAATVDHDCLLHDIACEASHPPAELPVAANANFRLG